MDYKELLKSIVDFCNEIKYENRFHIDNTSVLKEIYDYFKSNSTVTIKKGKKVYRARIDTSSQYNLEGTPLDKMGAPPIELANEGRINPIGMRYLYCAHELKTAISELRPWANAMVTVAEGIVKNDCKIIMFQKSYFEGSGDLTDHKTLFEISVNSLFTGRHSPQNRIGYLPSQYLSEYIKKEGFDGISYLSSLTKRGNNIAFFYPDLVEFHKTEVFKIQEVEYKYFNVNNKSENDTFK